MKTNTSKKVKVQKMGAFLSAVMPNIGVFIGWGIISCIIHTNRVAAK